MNLLHLYEFYHIYLVQNMNRVLKNFNKSFIFYFSFLIFADDRGMKTKNPNDT